MIEFEWYINRARINLDLLFEINGIKSDEDLKNYCDSKGFSHPKKKYFEESGERPWCTCFGSKVCGAYSDKGKKTNINFISSPSENKFATKVNSSYGCEEHVRNKFSVMSHGTPGVQGRNNTSCPFASKIEYSEF